MFPIRDNIPHRHYPMASRAVVILNSLVFVFQLGLSDYGLKKLFYLYGFVPARYFHPVWASWAGMPDFSLVPVLSHMFLHSGFLHFLVNMWILWVFADNIEDVMGPVKFFIFYLLCGLGALAGHVIFNLDSTVSVVGASGAIAGIMGAYLLLYPRAKVLTLIPIIIIPFFVELPAVIFLGFWFIMQLLSGLSSLAAQAAGGVAWWAHAFGFVAGMLLMPYFKDAKRCYYCHGLRGGNDFFFD